MGNEQHGQGVATLVCWCALLAGGALASDAQATGQRVGTVRDATGAVVPGAVVTLTGKTLTAPVAIETDDQGRFAIGVPPGIYQVSADVAASSPGAAR